MANAAAIWIAPRSVLGKAASRFLWPRYVLDYPYAYPIRGKCA